MKNKTLLSLIILSVLLSGGYLILQKDKLVKTPSKVNMPSPQEVPATPFPETDLTTEEVATADWKTYVSQKYGFEFKYPPEAMLNDEAENYVSVSFMGNKQKASGRTQTELFDGYALNVADVTDQGYENLDAFFDKKVEQLKEVCTSVGAPAEALISGKRAITHKLSCLGDFDSYYVLNDGTYLEIGLLTAGDAEDLPTYAKTVNLIFSTFEFAN